MSCTRTTPAEGRIRAIMRCLRGYTRDEDCGKTPSERNISVELNWHTSYITYTVHNINKSIVLELKINGNVLHVGTSGSRWFNV